MTDSDFEKLGQSPWLLSVTDLTDQSARTLLYGYTVERHTWHVYLDAQGAITVLRYREIGGRSMLISATCGPSGGCESNEDYVPDKRLYPESCDEEFCRLLHQAGISLPFTTRTEDAHERRLAAHGGFAGCIRESLPDLEALLVPYVDCAPSTCRSAMSGAMIAQQAARDLGLSFDESMDGIFVAKCDAPGLRNLVHEYRTAAGAAALPSSTDEVEADLRALVEAMGCYDAFLQSSSFTGCVVQANVQASGGLASLRVDRVGSDCRDLGHGAWLVTEPDTEMLLAVLPRPVFVEAGRVEPSKQEFTLLRQYLGEPAVLEKMTHSMLQALRPRAL